MSNERSVVVVTGGADGIGLRIAETFLNAGWPVHVCDADANAVERFAGHHPQAGASVTDIAASVEVDAMFAALAKEHDALGVLVNNAGIAGPTAPVESIETADWERTIAVDLNGAFYCTRRAVPMLKAGGGGSIINIASNAAFFGFPLRAPYAACKWALVGFTKTLAMELGPFGIRVNALCPGSVSGPRIERVIERDARTRGVDAESIRDVYRKHAIVRARGRRRAYRFVSRLRRRRRHLRPGARHRRAHRIVI